MAIMFTGPEPKAAKLAPNQRTEEPENPDQFAAHLSRLSYAKESVAIKLLEDFNASHITPLRLNFSDQQSSVSEIFAGTSRSWVFGLGFVLEGRAWIVFRGSDDLNDWAANITFYPGNHHGFRRTWNLVREATLNFAKNVQTVSDSIMITGHSLGGALATLATRDLANADHPVEALVTFGCPRVLSPWRARQFNKMNANHAGNTLGQVTRRYETGGEAVSKVPFFFLGFKHVGELTDFPKSPNQVRLASATNNNSSIVSGIRGLDQNLFAPVILPLLVLKAVVFGIDRVGPHMMKTYIESFNSFSQVFDMKPNDFNDDNKLGSAKLGSLIRLTVFAFIGLGLLVGVAGLSLYWTNMHPVLIAFWVAIAIASASMCK